MTSKNILIIGGLAVIAIYLASQAKKEPVYNGFQQPTMYGNLNSMPEGYEQYTGKAVWV